MPSSDLHQRKGASVASLRPLPRSGPLVTCYVSACVFICPGHAESGSKVTAGVWSPCPWAQRGCKAWVSWPGMPSREASPSSDCPWEERLLDDHPSWASGFPLGYAFYRLSKAPASKPQRPLARDHSERLLSMLFRDSLSEMMHMRNPGGCILNTATFTGPINPPACLRAKLVSVDAIEVVLCFWFLITCYFFFSAQAALMGSFVLCGLVLYNFGSFKGEKKTHKKTEK